MNILFLCNENAARSPMAEAILREMHPDWHIESAGIDVHVPGRGLGTATTAAIGRRRAALYLTTFRRKQVTKAMVDTAEHVACMTHAQVEWVNEHFPEARDKTSMLDSGDVADPTDRPGAHAVTYRVIKRILARW